MSRIYIKAGKINKCLTCKTKFYTCPSVTNRFCSKNCWYDFMRKNGNPFKGKTHTKETIERMIQSKTGQKLIKETKDKISKAHKGKHSGENCNWWKGGISSENNLARHSTELVEWRLAVFTRDKYTCKKCNNIGGKLNPHHIINFAQRKKLRFVKSNGITFCQKCHRIFHRKYGIKNNTRQQVLEFTQI